MWLVAATEFVVLMLDGMALAIIAWGSIDAFVRAVAMVVRRDGTEAALRHDIWLRYARWLVAALTFQLAADIAETAIAPSWEDLGKLAAIAAIRTALNFFLDRDMDDVRERERARAQTE